VTRRRWDRPDESDHVLLLADPDDSHRELVLPRLAAAPGRARAAALGRYPRYRVLVASDGDEALRLAESLGASELTVAAVDLVLPRLAGLELVQALRARSTDLAILAFAAVAPPSEAVAAVMAGADSFLEWRDDSTAEDMERALDLAIDRRALTRSIREGEAELESARGRLAALSGNLAGVIDTPAKGPTAEDVLPFKEAARRYLAAAARLHEGNAKELAARLGVSYFALRRLLTRFGVPFPKRPRAPVSRGR
jgi:DNA-binding NtrC family response regulator